VHGFTPQIVFGLDPIVVSTALLCVTYAAIIWDKVNRAIVALVAAVAVVLVGALDQAEALKGIDWNTIGVLAGMMILMSIAQRSGVFQFLAVWAAQRVRANPAGLLLLLQLTTAVISAFLNNVTTILLMAPVTLAIAKELRVPAFPFLFAEVFASNIGGTATLIGDPPNIMIGSLTGLGFNAFAVHLAPVILVVQAVQSLMVHLLWGRGMHATKEHRAHVMALEAGAAILDSALLKQSAAVLAVVILGFVLADRLGLEPATIAMAGAAVLMLLDNWRHDAEKQSRNVHQTFSDVEWITIFFFIGLFIVVHAVEMSGLLALLANKLVAATGGVHGACDFVGSESSLAFATGVLARGGKVVVTGLLGGSFSTAVAMFPIKAMTIEGTLTGTLAQARELIALLRTAKSAPIPISERPMAQAQAALDDLRAGKVVGRVVLTA